MDIDVSLIRELRALADAGSRPSELVRVIGARLALTGTSLRLPAIEYFRLAFAIPLADAMRIGALEDFGESGRSDSEIDRELTPILEQHRSLRSGA